MEQHYDRGHESLASGEAYRQSQACRPPERVFDISKGKLEPISTTNSSSKGRISGKADRPWNTDWRKKSSQLSGFPFSWFVSKDLELRKNRVPLSPSSPVPQPNGAAEITWAFTSAQPKSQVPQPNGAAETTSASTAAQPKSQVLQIPGFNGPPPPPPPPLPPVPLLRMPRTPAKSAAAVVHTSTQPTYPDPPARDAIPAASTSSQPTSSILRTKATVPFRPIRAVPSFYVDGCFGGESIVHLDGGGFKSVSELRKGDLIKCDFEGNTAEVACVLILPVPKGETTMAKFENGLVITPMHPVVSGGVWTLPKDLVKPFGVKLCQVFNFVLERQHTILVNGVICSALGHRRDGHTAHPFWGNWDSIVDCMKRIDRNAYEKGLVKVLGTMRKKDSGTVYGLRGTGGQLVSAEA